MKAAVRERLAWRSVYGRPTVIVVVLCVLFSMSTGPVFAGYSWCSRDPVFEFWRGGLLPEHVLDVQLRVYNNATPLTDVTAELDVTMPSNVVGVDRLELVTEEVFKIETAFHPKLKAASDASYDVFVDTFVPATGGQHKVELIITGVNGGVHVVCEGQTGKKLRAKVSVGALAATISCHDAASALPLLGG